MQFPVPTLYDHQWKMISIRALPHTAATGCGNLDLLLVHNYRIVTRDRHGNSLRVREFQPAQPYSHHSLPLLPKQCKRPRALLASVLEFLDSGLSMDRVSRGRVAGHITDALNHGSGPHNIAEGFCVEVGLEVTQIHVLVLHLPPASASASEAARRKLEAESFIPAEDDERAGSLGTCAVCLEYLSSGRSNDRRLVKMPCAHLFHNPCIFRWLDTSAACPVCRRVLED